MLMLMLCLPKAAPLLPHLLLLLPLVIKKNEKSKLSFVFFHYSRKKKVFLKNIYNLDAVVDPKLTILLLNAASHPPSPGSLAAPLAKNSSDAGTVPSPDLTSSSATAAATAALTSAALENGGNSSPARASALEACAASASAAARKAP